jgi:hypothetical protein
MKPMERKRSIYMVIGLDEVFLRVRLISMAEQVAFLNGVSKEPIVQSPFSFSIICFCCENPFLA